MLFSLLISVVRFLSCCIQDYGRIIGVSKRSCPACSYFLDLLISRTTNAEEDWFLTRGSHPTVSGCTLPPWTPSDIVAEMNATFGRELRRELIAILARNDATIITRDRSSSITSQSLSVDSNETHDAPEDVIDYFPAATTAEFAQWPM